MSRENTEPVDGRKRRWEQHNADRRRMVIDAALAVLEREGRPTEQVSAQQIADEAKIHRTGIYRYFDDRADLDIAIQRTVCDRLEQTLTSAVVLEGTARTVVRRVVGAYLRWVVAHPGWTYVIEQPTLGADSPLQETITRVAARIESSLAMVLTLVDAELSADDLTLVTPWVSSLVTGCMGAVRAWRAQDQPLDLDRFVDFLADTIWIQITGLSASRGLTLPDAPLDELLG